MSSPRGLFYQPPRRLPPPGYHDRHAPDHYRPASDTYRPNRRDRVLHGRVSRRGSLTPVPARRQEQHQEDWDRTPNARDINTGGQDAGVNGRWNSGGRNNGGWNNGGWNNNMEVAMRQVWQVVSDLQDENASFRRDIQRLRASVATANSHLRVQSAWINQTFQSLRAPPPTFEPFSPHRFSPPPLSIHSSSPPPPPPGYRANPSAYT